MLEVKNLCKTYKTKKGAETRALDGVSIRFPETGLVFLLGKSGSGKSTLLNICGGLDTADSGEIVIMGRSSRDFSPTDFDSYRNTFVGFVFQEYNILGEFTVEDNIALALELQNKKRDSAKVAQILQSVDLGEFAKRRPNTLSGGQKQRVAIARALVKEPRIILADEPTGALDSDTGRQVLETLKKLSADKLVIVVSHDREFAELYADRIVELKDGKVISDVTRAGESGSQPNVRFFEDTVAVRDCAALTDEDFAAIRRFLSSSKSGAMLSCNRAEVAKAQSAAPNAAGKFEETKQQPAERSYTADEQKLIRSHLPFRYAFRMGASCVRTHPVRLAFSIFLCLVAFVMFGIFSTVMFYDEQRAARDALAESDAVYLSYYKAFRATTEYYSNGEFTFSSSDISQTPLTAQEYAAMQKEYPGTLAVLRNGPMTVDGWDIEDSRFYTDTLQGYVYAEGNAGLPQLLWGRHPQNANEAAISDFTFHCLRNGTFAPGEGDAIEIESYDDLNSLPVLSLPGAEVKIVGVYAGEPVPARFEELRQAAEQHTYFEDINIQSSWQNMRDIGLYTYVLMHDSFAEVYRSQSSQQPEQASPFAYFLPYEHHVTCGGDYGSQYYINPYTEEHGLPLLELYSLADTQKAAALGQGEIALSLQKYAEVLGRALDYAVSDKYESAMQGGSEEEIAEATACNEEYNAEGGARSVLNDLSRGYTETGETGENGLPVLRAFTMEEIAADLAKVTAFLQKYSLETPAFSVSANYSSAALNVQCTAFFYEPGGGLNDCSYVSQDIFNTLIGWQSLNTTQTVTNYNVPEGAFISGVFVPDFRTNGALNALTAQTFAVAADDSTALIDNVEMHDAQRTSETVAWMRWFFLGAGLGLTLFAVLLMFNFISASIAAKKKEIGILRAVGARATDVYKVFFSEALIVAAACFVLAVIACAVLAPAISNLLIESTLLTIRLLRFGPLSVLFMAAVALFTAAVSTLVPVAIYSRKPPVESIRAL